MKGFRNSMEQFKDRINQMIYRASQAINEASFCLSILNEQAIQTKLFMENSYTLKNLYNINLRMLIIDIYTLVNITEISKLKKG